MKPQWPAPTPRGPVRAEVVLPGSKSLTNRALVLAALSDGPSVVRRALRSRDTLLMAGALRSLGLGVEDVDGDDWLVTPAPLAGDVDVDCGLAGTVMRFVPPLAALAAGPVRFDGDPHARTRPMGPALAALRTLGAALDAMADFPFKGDSDARFEGPALFVRGTRSRYVADEVLPAVGRFFPRFEVADVESGHWVVSESPEAFRRAAVEFLREKE